MHKEPIKFCSFGGYVPFCSHWWKDLGWWLTRGWASDIKQYWLRARYGWAPKDVWSLDWYLASVVGEALEHLAATSHGTPMCYPHTGEHACSEDHVPDHDLWRADLRRWAKAFRDYAQEPEYDKPNWIDADRARMEAVQRTLLEIAPWYGGLWD